MKRHAIIVALTTLIISMQSWSQEIILMDRFDDNKVVNDSVILAFSTNTSITDLTKYFVIKNNTDQTLALFLKKTHNFMADSTSDYFCFGIKCWPEEDSTTIADTIHAGAEDYNFASHVTHVRRFDMPPLPPGLSSITYTIFDHTSMPEPVEARVTVIYHLSPVGVEEQVTEASAVYPNPANDMLNVEIPVKKDPVQTLFVYDGLGRPVIERMVSMQDGRLTIQVEELQPGMYYGFLLPENGAPVSFKFMVTR